MKLFYIISSILMYNRRYNMEPIQRLYKKDKIVTRSLHIDEDLYAKLQYLCEEVFDTSISKVVNICVETLLQDKENIKFYKKPYKTDSIYRSILFRKEFYDELIAIRNKKGISFSRLVNGSIKEFLDKYQGKYFKIK